eukprot:8978542-Pyramimonas_sp.AAC.2
MQVRPTCRLEVPLVDVAILVNAKDRRIGRVDENPQILRNPLQLPLRAFSLGDVLSDTHHSHDAAASVAAGGAVQEDVDTLLVFGEQWKLEVGALHAQQAVVENCSHRALVLAANKLIHQ